MTRKRVTPSSTFYSKPYWDGCRNNELLFERCDRCSSVQFYPRTICSNCWSTELTWVQSQGIGVIVSYTVVHRAPSSEFLDDIPYAIVFVRLEEGVHMLGSLKGVREGAHIRIGEKVRVNFEPIDDGVSIPFFEVLPI